MSKLRETRIPDFPFLRLELCACVRMCVHARTLDFSPAITRWIPQTIHLANNNSGIIRVLRFQMPRGADKYPRPPSYAFENRNKRMPVPTNYDVVSCGSLVSSAKIVPKIATLPPHFLPCESAQQAHPIPNFYPHGSIKALFFKLWSKMSSHC